MQQFHYACNEIIIDIFYLFTKNSPYKTSFHYSFYEINYGCFDFLFSQKTLSNMRIPSYIGEVICTDINIGNVPPRIAGVRVVPIELSEAWAFEVDIEYSGGAVVEIETRLEVGELELHTDAEDSNPEPGNVGAVPSDLLEGFESLGKDLILEERKNDLQEQKEDDDWNTG